MLVMKHGTKSFYEDPILDTEGAIANLERALDEAERRGPMVFDRPITIEDDPEFLREFIEAE